MPLRPGLPPPIRFLALVLSLMAAAPAFCATITVTGSWVRTISAADLISGAGSNLTSSFESLSNAIMMDVTGTITGLTYRVYARRAAGLPAAVTVAVKRTSNGTGLSLISGGTSYITLGTTDTEIFNGLLDRSNVALQINATGFSVAIPPATYAGGVIFSITP